MADEIMVHVLTNALGGRSPLQWTDAPEPVAVVVRLVCSDTGVEEVPDEADA